MGFTENDLLRMGMAKDNNGVWSKPKPKRAAKTVKVKPDTAIFFKNQDIQDVYAQCEKDGTIFIPGNVPSSKNLKRAFGNKLITGKRVVEYKKATDVHWRIFKSRFLEMVIGKEKPYRVEVFFVRDSRRKADFHNLIQLPADLMVEHGFLFDDNMDEVVFIPKIPAYGIDKKMAGVIIRVL